MRGFGEVVFECMDCKARFRPRRKEWARVSGVSCPKCGSRFWIESREARKKGTLARQAEKLGAVGNATRRDAAQERKQ